MLKMYMVLGLSIIAAIALFASFDWDDPSDYDASGIVHDVKETGNGYVFELFTVQGFDIRCFFSSEPSDLGHYGLIGSSSSDGSIFFVFSMEDFDGAGLNAAIQSQ
jgi:hypothetical protein